MYYRVHNVPEMRPTLLCIDNTRMYSRSLTGRVTKERQDVKKKIGKSQSGERTRLVISRLSKCPREPDV